EGAYGGPALQLNPVVPDFKGVVGGTDCAGLFAECCGDGGNMVVQRSPFKSIEILANGFKQCRSGLRYAAPDNNDLRIKSIDKRGDRCGQVMDRPKPNCCSLNVSGKMCFDEFARG